ncbi:MAG: hypothetical protein M1818_000532 [Claussenomyces sp. TS43310]|nr:MAG: hypothetical protein M1818_000532 [Claussenomyces sp. TS43310]
MSHPKRTLLLCFIHGFKGDAETFYDFPADLRAVVSEKLDEDHIETVVYPKYETRGDLAECSVIFVDWLKEQVVNIRKKRSEKPWPPTDRSVGVVLVAHSMGGFVASDALFSILNERRDKNEENNVMFPLIQGILAFDTPYNSLARSMFVYGGFSQYQKVSSVWNMMSAASAGLYSMKTIGGTSSTNALRSTPATKQSNAWKLWQSVTVRSGTAGAIAAGGVAAYVNRGAILNSAKNLNKNSIKEGYAQGYDMLGQGLAYINRDSLGHSFAWLSSHLKFVGALLKQKELNQRLERLASLQGVGVQNIYISLGENGYWTGGYFVPERTFCAVPTPEQSSYKLFTRIVNTVSEDEVQAHMTMFRKELNSGYEEMSKKASEIILAWFRDDLQIVDIPPPAQSPETTPSINTDDGELPLPPDDISDVSDISLVQDSPLDIAAAAATVALPEETEDDMEENEKQTYLRSLMRIASNAGIGVKSFWGSRKTVPGKDAQSSAPAAADTSQENDSVTKEDDSQFGKSNTDNKGTRNDAERTLDMANAS